MQTAVAVAYLDDPSPLKLIGVGATESYPGFTAIIILFAGISGISPQILQFTIASQLLFAVVAYALSHRLSNSHAIAALTTVTLATGAFATEYSLWHHGMGRLVLFPCIILLHRLALGPHKPGLLALLALLLLGINTISYTGEAWALSFFLAFSGSIGYYVFWRSRMSPRIPDLKAALPSSLGALLAGIIVYFLAFNTVIYNRFVPQLATKSQPVEVLERFITNYAHVIPIIGSRFSPPSRGLYDFVLTPPLWASLLMTVKFAVNLLALLFALIFIWRGTQRGLKHQITSRAASLGLVAIILFDFIAYTAYGVVLLRSLLFVAPLAVAIWASIGATKRKPVTVSSLLAVAAIAGFVANATAGGLYYSPPQYAEVDQGADFFVTHTDLNHTALSDLTTNARLYIAYAKQGQSPQLVTFNGKTYANFLEGFPINESNGRVYVEFVIANTGHRNDFIDTIDYIRLRPLGQDADQLSSHPDRNLLYSDGGLEIIKLGPLARLRHSAGSNQ